MPDKTRIEPFEQFVLRTPLFSFDKLEKFYELVDGIGTPFSIKEMATIEEALYLASPDLWSEWKKWRNGELTDDTKIRKLQISVLKYFKRMCTRCTPFGLFAGCSTGKVSDKSSIILSESTGFHRHTRLDMHYTCALAQELAKHPIVRKHIQYYPNTSIYELGDQTRYVDYHYKGKIRVHQISAIDQNYYANKVLERAKNGAYLNELIDCITTEGVEIEPATQFLNELLSIQLLVNDLEPSVTGTELIDQIQQVLESVSLRLTRNEELEELSSLKNKIDAIKASVKNLDVAIGNPIETYGSLQDRVNEMGIGYEKSKLLQTDLFSKTKACELDRESFENVRDAVHLLNRLTPPRPHPNINRFIERFKERYETEEIPLLEVMDVETGIGYLEGKNGDASPIIQRVPVATTSGEQKISWNPTQSFILKKLNEAAKNESFEIVLIPDDFRKGDPNWDDTIDTLSVMIKHLGYRDGSPLIYLSSAGGSSAANLLGRFAHGDPELKNLVQQITAREKENRKNTLLAEIVHLPESRTGNILMRPVFREYEIPYLAKPSVSPENVIGVDDLTLSVRRNKLILKSKKFNKEVVPHLSNAHNYRNNALPIYHFLCDMQHYNRRTGFYFPFGHLQSEFSFIPRITYQNVVLSMAQWKQSKSDFKELTTCNETELLEVAETWRKKHKMPQRLVLADGDNELFIDLHSEWSLRVFREAIKKRGSIQLKEFGYDPENLLVTNENGAGFTNQMVLAYERLLEQKTETSPLPNRNEQKIESSIQRDFNIGSEWLYFKIYCGPKTADRVLTEVVGPMAREFVKKGWIDHWFFIRYVDPHKHLRLRFHIPNLENLGRVITTFNQEIDPWKNEKQVWSIVADSYKRELERYNPATIEWSEQLFHFESQCIVDFLNMVQPQDAEETRWLFSIKMLDQIFEDFGLTLSEKEQVASSMKTNFAREFGANKTTRKSLATKYREHRQKIEHFLSGTVNGTPYHKQVYELIESKSQDSKQIVSRIKEAIDAGLTQTSKNALLLSYCHMLMNRTFRSNQRLHEMVIYDLLHTSYKSLIGRQKKKKTTVATQAE